jgi:Cu(I)/Ag(I) efflux system membrane fusion protein
MPTRVLRFVLVVLTLSLAGQASAGDLKTDIVDPYLRIQVALAGDTITGVPQDAVAIAKAAGTLGPAGAKLVDAAVALQRAADIAAARASFWSLSDALLAYGKAMKTSLGPGVRSAYCPMEKKSWAQRDGQIANPYAGKRMLRCGEFTSPAGA